MSGYHIQTVKEVPLVLTNKDWQKKKGLTKLTKSTGLGAELDKLQALVDKVDTVALDPSTSPAPSTQAELQKRIQKSMDHYKATVEPIRKQLVVIEKKAAETEKLMEKATGGSGAAKAAAAIAKEAPSFSMKLKSLDMQSKIEIAEKRIALRQNLARKEIGPSITKLISALEKFETSDHSFKSWDDHVKNPGRSVSQYVEELDAYNKAYWNKIKVFNGFDLVTIKMAESGPENDKKRKKLGELALKLVNEIKDFKG